MTIDVRINEIHNNVRTIDSQSLLDPRILRQIVQACVQAVRDDQAREKRLMSERRMSNTPPNSDGA